MFKRIVNNQALLNGLKQIKRSDNNDQNQIILAGNQSSTSITTLQYGTPNKLATELEEFCTSIVPQDSAIFKIAKQICAEQGSRIQEIALEVLKDSGLGNINNGTTKKSESSLPSIVKTVTTSSPSSTNAVSNTGQSSNVTFEPIEQAKPKRNDRFYGTNKMFLLGEDEIVNINTATTTPLIINTLDTSEETHSAKSLNLDIVKRLLMDIFGKLKNLVMVLLNNWFGNRQNVQSDNVTTQITAQSLVIVISFMIYNIVTVSSPVEMHKDILLVFQDYLSRHLQN